VNLESVVTIKNIDYKQKKPILGEIGYLNVQQNITISSSKGKLFKHKNHKYIMDKQTELKAKIGEIQLQLESLQVQANQLMGLKQKATADLVEEMKTAVTPKTTD